MLLDPPYQISQLKGAQTVNDGKVKAIGIFEIPIFGWPKAVELSIRCEQDIWLIAILSYYCETWQKEE